MSLGYDTEGDQGGSTKGNLTDDGLFLYVYDAWNRLVEVTRRVDDETSVATYAWDGMGRRESKVVQHCGDEQTDNDGGDTTLHFYYSNRRQPLELRNGSNQTLAQYVWGNFGELVMADINGDPTESSNCDPDDQTYESTADDRTFAHQDRAGRIVALTEYDISGTNNGRIVNRISYAAYGPTIILAGDSGSGEMAYAQPPSSVGYATPPTASSYGDAGDPGLSLICISWSRCECEGCEAVQITVKATAHPSEQEIVDCNECENEDVRKELMAKLKDELLAVSNLPGTCTGTCGAACYWTPSLAIGPVFGIWTIPPASVYLADCEATASSGTSTPSWSQGPDRVVDGLMAVDCFATISAQKSCDCPIDVSFALELAKYEGGWKKWIPGQGWQGWW